MHQDVDARSQRLIGVETAGFSHVGQAWRLSTVEQWQFFGSDRPVAETQERIKHFCRQVFELFNP